MQPWTKNIRWLNFFSYQLILTSWTETWPNCKWCQDSRILPKVKSLEGKKVGDVSVVRGSLSLTAVNVKKPSVLFVGLQFKTVHLVRLIPSNSSKWVYSSNNLNDKPWLYSIVNISECSRGRELIYLVFLNIRFFNVFVRSSCVFQ